MPTEKSFSKSENIVSRLGKRSFLTEKTLFSDLENTLSHDENDVRFILAPVYYDTKSAFSFVQFMEKMYLCSNIEW